MMKKLVFFVSKKNKSIFSHCTSATKAIRPKSWRIPSFLAFIFFILIIMLLQAKEVRSENDYQVIPDEAIRLRILANSDNDKDQQLKRLVRDKVNEEISAWVKDITDINEARKLIEQRIPEIKSTVKSVLKQQGKSHISQVEYRENVTFPLKLYGSYLYPAGEYEAVLITLGKGKGANWWCVLFPPLCFLDFSNGASVAEVDTEEVDETELEEDEVEVKFFLFEWFGWT